MRGDTPLERLFALEQFGIKLGLDNIRRLTHALGDPQQQFETVHVGGTNGKGSVTAMVEHALRHAGYRTGRYTSPHLARIEERVTIDGAPIGEGPFADITSDVLETIDRLRTGGGLDAMPTFFEATTAVAFEAFRRAGVHVGVIEVGLGGRFDATNVITPRVAAITSIALDHQKYLGDSLMSIAFEKAGILKTGVPAVIGSVPREAQDMIEEVAAQRQVPLSYADSRLIERLTMTEGRTRVTVRTAARRYEGVRLALNGRHQVENAVVAIRVLETLAEQGYRLAADDVVAGVADVSWPARLEWLEVNDRGQVLIDAAHNVAGAAALAAYLLDSGFAPLPIVVAVMRDKDVTGIVGALVPAAARFVVTTVHTTARALSARELASQAAAVAGAVPVDVEADPERALAAAFVGSTRIAAAGSIFFVGPLRERLLAAGALSLQGS